MYYLFMLNTERKKTDPYKLYFKERCDFQVCFQITFVLYQKVMANKKLSGLRPEILLHLGLNIRIMDQMGFLEPSWNTCDQ